MGEEKMNEVKETGETGETDARSRESFPTREGEERVLRTHDTCSLCLILDLHLPS